MKRQTLLYLMLFALVGLASCTREIQFNGDETEPKLVLYSVARAGEPLEVEVSHSAFFLKSGPASSYVESLKPESGTVRLYVNGSSVPYFLTRRAPQDTYDAPLYYDSTYVPSEGDRLRLVVSFPGFDEVSAEVEVPVSSVLTVDSATLRPISEDSYGSYCYYDVAMTVHRGADPTCYYGIRPYLHVKYRIGEEEMEEDYSWDMQSDDYLFQGNGSTTDQIAQLMTGDDVSMLFADTKIPSDSYSFRGSFLSYTLEEIRADGVEADFFLVFSTMTRDLYYYRTSLATANSSSSFSLFSEASSIYSKDRKSVV